MIEVVESDVFAGWFAGLRDSQAKARILVRIKRLAGGNAGDAKPVGAGLSEMRINYGPGYRVYYQQRGRVLVILLCGGEKSTQSSDILAAKKIADHWKE
jgi:putative addiction module killer protein